MEVRTSNKDTTTQLLVVTLRQLMYDALMLITNAPLCTTLGSWNEATFGEERGWLGVTSTIKYVLMTGGTGAGGLSLQSRLLGIHRK